jgi:hypothetical protein
MVTKKMAESDRKKVINLIKQIKNCKTWDYIKYLPQREQQMQYTPLIGDPCYKYSRMAKELFFSSPHACFLFYITIPYCIGIIESDDKYALLTYGIIESFR